MVMDEVLRDASSWPDDHHVSINVSAVQLRTPAILSQLHRAMTEYGLSPRQVEIEISETAMVDNGGQIATMLAGSRALGVRMAIDDFGTGYSSLAHFREFKIDRIEIDRSFVSGVEATADEEAGSAAVVRAVIGMARELSTATTAEGIETAAQLRRMTEFGCGAGQWNLLGRPMDVASVEALLRDAEAVA